ncbi:hypothetical protein MMC19_006589 [Ptychographa xylographoides]|nr:hypothetical protein [Ptychographa xylographoides]
MSKVDDIEAGTDLDEFAVPTIAGSRGQKRDVALEGFVGEPSPLICQNCKFAARDFIN